MRSTFLVVICCSVSVAFCDADLRVQRKEHFSCFSARSNVHTVLWILVPHKPTQEITTDFPPRFSIAIFQRFASCLSSTSGFYGSFTAGSVELSDRKGEGTKGLPCACREGRTQAWGWCRESLVGLLGAYSCPWHLCIHMHTWVCAHIHIHRHRQACSHVHRTPTLTYVHTNVNAHALTCTNTHVLPQTTH